MLNLIGRVLLWLRGGSLKLLILAGIILLVWGTFSPVGTLVWWLNEGAENLGLRKNQLRRSLSSSSNASASSSDEPEQTPSSEINCYIVFLTGVGDFSANQLAPGEELFLERLAQTYPNCVAVDDVFPYSAANESLEEAKRFLAPVWRFASKADGWLSGINAIIKIRNLWRMAISIDDRYGPVYNQGIASAIVERMNATHPIPTTNESERSPHVILVGTSGGAQVALGAATYLGQWLQAEITVISVGGVFAGSDGFSSIKHFYHLQGHRDWIEDIGFVFPSRWLSTVGSPFNQALRQGKYTVHMTGPHKHDGPEGYFGEEAIAPGAIAYVDLTLQKVNQLPIWADIR